VTPTLAALACLLTASAAAADPLVLRMASIAPEGTGWARELKSFARDVETQTRGAVHIKWYLGGIAGDDVQAGERIRRDQLDGTASGGMLCERLSPHMRAIHAVTTSRDEALFVLNRVRPQLEEEFARSGFAFLGSAGLGPDVLFTRQPVRTLADLQKTRLWVWDLDEVTRLQLPAVGVPAVPTSVADAARAYDDGRTDGFLAVPAAALAFQWSAQARYVSDLSTGFVSACVLLSNRAFDALPNESRDALRTATAKLQARVQDLGHQQDDALLGGLFARQGTTALKASDSFRRQYAEAAARARASLGDKLGAPDVLSQALALVESFRREHLTAPR
jgi:TRAP-type transport system periplasmic protein